MHLAVCLTDTKEISDKNTTWDVFNPPTKKQKEKKSKRNHKHDKDYDKHWRNCAIGQSEL